MLRGDLPVAAVASSALMLEEQKMSEKKLKKTPGKAIEERAGKKSKNKEVSSANKQDLEMQ